MAIPYGFEKMADGNVRMVASEIEVVQRIYQCYVDGASLGGIAAELEANHIVAPSGNTKWSRSAIDKILSNGKYVLYALPMELFLSAQFKKGYHTNIKIDNDGSTQRKTTRYSSQNVLSGLLVCIECGSDHRRITRSSGEVVWRCSDRVEKGKQSACKLSPTVTDVAIKELIYKELGLAKFDEQAAQDNISQVLIAIDSTIDIVRKSEMILQL